jgi:hemolysin activation/secretion protein
MTRSARALIALACCAQLAVATIAHAQRLLPPAPPPSPAPATEAPAAAPAAAEPTGPSVPETICEGRRIAGIEIKGQGRVSADDIRATVKLREGLPCTDGEVTHDAQSIWDLGYFRDVRVEGDPIEKDGIKQIVLRFVVDERPAIGEIKYVGNDALDTSDIEEKVTLKAGSILSVPEVRTQVQKIKDFYAEKGFFLAEVKYELKEKANNEVEVDFVINEGAEVSVRRLRFVGNEKVSDRELHAIMQTNEMNVFSFVERPLQARDLRRRREPPARALLRPRLPHRGDGRPAHRAHGRPPLHRRDGSHQGRPALPCEPRARDGGRRPGQGDRAPARPQRAAREHRAESRRLV